MPAFSPQEALEHLAQGVENASPLTLSEIFAELFPDRPIVAPPNVADLVGHIRGGLETEEILDLWNVVFPADRNVCFDEEDGSIHWNEGVVSYTDTD